MGNDIQSDTVLLLILMEWPEHGVVVQCRGQDMTFFIYSSQKTWYEDVQGIRCVVGEHEVFGRVSSQERGESLPGQRKVVFALGPGRPP